MLEEPSARSVSGSVLRTIEAAWLEVRVNTSGLEATNPLSGSIARAVIETGPGVVQLTRVACATPAVVTSASVIIPAEVSKVTRVPSETGL